MLVICNAKIHTLNPTHPIASAIAIEQGRILAIGNDDEILAASGFSHPIDASCLAIIPGLTDAHIHLLEYALSLQKVDCETASQADCLCRVAAQVAITQPEEWVMGHAWNQNNWPEGYGTAHQLDQFSPHNPVFLTHKSHHSAWVNSVALQLAGIDRNTPDPSGGLIGHLPDGEPDGILYESAVNLIENIIPEPSTNQIVQSLHAAIPILWKMGLTGVHDFDGRQCFSGLQILHQEHELRLRVVKSLALENLSNAIRLGLRSGYGDDMLCIGPVKLFADGALGPHTAAMLEPYENEPDNCGILMLSPKEMFEYGQQAVEHGISLAIHAIGDFANREVLDAYKLLRQHEQLLQPQPGVQLRHRIEHVQVLHPDDLPRFAALNIVASMQPIHATSDMWMADRYWGDRSAYAYAWRSLLENGSSLIFGSDAPVESPNPFWGIHAAVTRRRANGSPSAQGWRPKQCLRLSEALQAYTANPTFAAHMEDRLGKLAPGYLADLIVLDQDPFSVPADEILNIHPLATMVGGEWVHFELE